jgi:hypothetical protein
MQARQQEFLWGYSVSIHVEGCSLLQLCIQEDVDRYSIPSM